jgi:hypothetical protein
MPAPLSVTVPSAWLPPGGTTDAALRVGRARFRGRWWRSAALSDVRRNTVGFAAWARETCADRRSRRMPARMRARHQ